MVDINLHDLSGVTETLLIPLYVRAIETQRPDALLNDIKALELVKTRESDFLRIKQIKMDKNDQTVLILRNREFDHFEQDFMARYPEATVIHIGCGLDSRFERVDNGQVEWYDLDLPEVIELRRKIMGDEGQRYHFLPYSVFNNVWLNKVNSHRQLPVLLLAEGVFMYFEEEQIKSLVIKLHDYFPGAELIFDAFSPFLVKMNNFRFRISRSKIIAPYKWGLKHSKDPEEWAKGIILLDDWFPFDRPEPRLANIQWLRYFPVLAKVMGIFHYRFEQKKI